MSGFDLQGFLAGLDEWAAALSGPVRTYRYGAHPDQEGDLRLPGDEGPHPVAVLVHGGFWRAQYTRATTAALAADLARRGWATWNVEYRRVGTGGGVPETLDDVEAALAHLGELEEPLDLSRVVAIGHSAGGHLALWAAGTGRASAAVALAGVCDLAHAAETGIGQGAAREFAEDAVAAADPIRRLPTGIPTLLVHGDADDRVPVEQSRRYAAAARAAGDRCELLELPGVGHFEPIDPRGDAWAQVAARLELL